MKCPNCGSEKVILDQDHGEVKCSDCGFVVEEVVDTGQEWRAYDGEQLVARARAEPVKAPSRLATVIGRPGALSAERRYEFARLSLIQDSISADERSVSAGKREIARIAAAAQLPQQVKEEAQRLFTVAHKEGLLKGGSVAAMAVACLALACREFGLPSVTHKLVELSAADMQRVRRCYTALLECLGKRVILKPPTPLKYVPMIAGKLGVSTKVQRTAAEIIKAAEEGKIILGKPPRSVAAAALYIAALIHGERERGRQEIAEAAGITETTLRKRAKELMKRLDITVQV
ncbi:MAG: TFIIB-type zinc ribbon-containing protein [Thermofilaceae archaeon]